MSAAQHPPTNPNVPPVFQDDEITLKELIEKILEFWRELWKNKWWIILFSIPFIAYFAYQAKNTDITYQASLTYTLNDGSSGGGGLAGILGNFGLGRGGKVNMDKIVALSKSRNIVQKVLFTPIALDTFGGKTNYIANHLIDLYNWDKEWAKNQPEMDGFRFETDSVTNFSLKELTVLKMLHGKVIGGKNIKNPIFSNGFNDDTGILTISATTVDEQLSIEFCNLAFRELRNYYILNTINAQKNTFEFVQAKTDSIVSVLRSKEFQLARFSDENRNLTDASRLAQKKILETEVGKLKLMYGEASKNYELADFSLQNSTPEINIIDEPLPPLDPLGASLLISLIKGALLGGLIAAGFVIGRKIVVDAMAA